MLDFLMNDKEYEIQANGQVATILSHFNSDYVMDVVRNTLSEQFNHFDTVPKPNIAESFETYFKELLRTYPTDETNILETRHQTYTDIRDIICRQFALGFVNEDDVDMYSITTLLYDFFVAKFNFYMVNFYCRYIAAEKSALFMNMGLEKASKEDNSSMNYARHAFGDDEELAAVIANLPVVLGALKSIDVPDRYVYQTAYGNNQLLIDLIDSHIQPTTSIYNIYNSILFNPTLYPIIVTQIRLKIQMQNTNIDPTQIKGAFGK